MTDYESIKFDICCAARLLHRQGLSVANAGHLSVAVGPDEMLVNHYGPSFATLRPENVVRVSFAGKVLEGDAYVNDSIRLHGIIHRENPRAVVTLSALRVVPEVYDQESCLLVDDVGVVEEDYEGTASEEGRVMPVADALRERPVVILPNHGAIATGENIQLAFVRMSLLEGMARRNLSVAQAARDLGREPVAIAPAAARRAKAEIGRIPVLPTLWQDFLKQLRKSDPDLFEGREN
jgi:ribulose-5-phosphate 4-epimerase/fuculose-1-phosphate aldolase